MFASIEGGRLPLKNKFKPKHRIESIWFIHLINGDFVLKSKYFNDVLIQFYQ